MGLDVYFPADIRNALLAAEQAVGAMADAAGGKDDPFTAGFLAGYRAALTTLALVFGLVGHSETSLTEGNQRSRPPLRHSHGGADPASKRR